MTTDSVITSRISMAARDSYATIGFAAVAPPSPTQLHWRRRIEAALRVVAPALDLLLAAGDRVSRVVARGDGERDSLPAPRRCRRAAGSARASRPGDR